MSHCAKSGSEAAIRAGLEGEYETNPYFQPTYSKQSVTSYAKRTHLPPTSDPNGTGLRIYRKLDIV